MKTVPQPSSSLHTKGVGWSFAGLFSFSNNNIDVFTVLDHKILGRLRKRLLSCEKLISRIATCVFFHIIFNSSHSAKWENLLFSLNFYCFLMDFIDFHNLKIKICYVMLL